MSASELAIYLVTPYVAALASKYNVFINITSNPKAYAESLYHTVSYVRESVPTLVRVADCRPDHSAAQWLRKHADEEKGHDKVFYQDLLAVNAGTKFPPSPAVEEFIRLERNICAASDPVASVFGDMLVLECFPPTKEYIAHMVGNYGLSIKCARGHILHSHVDKDHRDGVLRCLDSGDIDISGVIDRSIITCRLFCRHWDLMQERYAGDRSIACP